MRPQSRDSPVNSHATHDRRGAGGARTHDRRIMRVTRRAGREGHSPAGLRGWLLLVRVLRWLFGTGCGLDADCLPGGTHSEGMPSQLPGLSTVDGCQGRPGCQPAGALGLGLDRRPAAVRTLGRWEGLPGCDVRTQPVRRGRVLQKKPAIASAVSEVPTAVSHTCETAAPMATPALTTASTAKPIRALLDVGAGGWAMSRIMKGSRRRRWRCSADGRAYPGVGGRTLLAVRLWSRYLDSRARSRSRAASAYRALPFRAWLLRTAGLVVLSAAFGAVFFPLLGLELGRAGAAYFAGVIQLGCQVVLRLFGRLFARREAGI